MIKRGLIVLITLIGLGGCTVLPPAPLPDVAECKGNLECIYEKMDEDRFEVAKALGVSQMKQMEGYAPVSLETLNDTGRLKVDRMNPLSVSLGVFGLAHIRFKEYGGIYDCSVYYTTEWSLLHELRHCQGFWEREPYIWLPTSYLDTQKELMERDGVNKWYDTEYYKNEDGTNHWILKR